MWCENQISVISITKSVWHTKNKGKNPGKLELQSVKSSNNKTNFNTDITKKKTQKPEPLRETRPQNSFSYILYKKITYHDSHIQYEIQKSKHCYKAEQQNIPY